MKEKINKEKTNWLEPTDWSYRNNKARKKGASDNGLHPTIAVGENGNKIANIGITHQAKRGHHKNIALNSNPNPKDQRTAYIRDDLQYDDKKFLKELLSGYKKLPSKDQEAVLKIINKKR